MESKLSITSITETVNESVNDDLDSASASKLQAMKAKLKKEKNKEAILDSAPVVVAPKRALEMFVVGSGQCGSRIAETFYKLGYPAVAVNTASQDLAYIDIPEENKYLLKYGLGGAARDRTIGRDAVLYHRDQLLQFITEKDPGAYLNVLCASLGGGSGSGSFQPMIDILAESGKPLVVICVLPMGSDDLPAKANALDALAEIAENIKARKVQNLILVDNSKIETIYSDVNQMDFFRVANEAIVNPIDVINTFSMSKSKVKGFDPMEWHKVLLDGGALSTFGEMTVQNYSDDIALAEAVTNSLNGNLLSDDFDLSEAMYCGVIYAAPSHVWAKIPRRSVTHAQDMIGEILGSTEGLMFGIYEDETLGDEVKIYTMFSGLSLPKKRIDVLRDEVRVKKDALKAKESGRDRNLTVDVGKHSTQSAADQIREAIKKKASPTSRLLPGVPGVIDRRK
jgi:cell division GTPase FtsZ